MLDNELLAQLTSVLQTHASGSPLRSRAATPHARSEDRKTQGEEQDTGRQLFSENESSFLSQFLQSLYRDLAPLPLPSASTQPPEAPGETSNEAPPSPSEHAPKRRRHVVSEQRRRNQIREGFTHLAELLDTGRLYGARALGLNSGAGTGVEDEDLDDRTDAEEDLSLGCDEEEVQRRRKNAQRRARSRANAGKQARGRGRGRGGSAGCAGSKSAVLFQVVDLLYWLEQRNAALRQDISVLSTAV